MLRAALGLCDRGSEAWQLVSAYSWCPDQGAGLCVNFNVISYLTAHSFIHSLTNFP